jgi:hypothetical protein
MILEEVKRAFRSRLKRKVLWAVFFMASLAWLINLAISWKLNPNHSGFPELGMDLLLGLEDIAVFYFMFIWVSPIPWQWDGRPGTSPAISGRLFIAFFAAEILILACVGVNSWLNQLVGRAAIPGFIYQANLCFQGPALFLVGSLQATRERLEHEREELRQRTDAVMAEHLKGQVHPHVLFNTLNGLAELMQVDHGAAEELVEAMSGFLHRVLDASQQGAWPLREERSLTEDYLKMEATRLGSRLRLQCDWDAPLMDQMVLPLMLQPLVENAIKHGISKSDEGGMLSISTRQEGDKIVLEVKNTVSTEPKPPSTRRGLGLPNLRRRLELAYGALASFVFLENQDGWTVTRITLQASSVPRQ